jgi:hypothetical protein
MAAAPVRLPLFEPMLAAPARDVPARPEDWAEEACGTAPFTELRSPVREIALIEHGAWAVGVTLTSQVS